MILLVGAVERELTRWRPHPAVDSLIGGVGPVEAACAVADRLARRPYRLVIGAGIAGAIAGAAQVGDGVIVADDALELSLENGDPIALPSGERVVTRAHSDPALVARLRERGFPALHGITVARVTGTEATAAQLARGGAQVETMEGFAVLRAAERAGVPAIELRGISNRVGSRERSGWNFDAGLAGLDRVLGALLESLDAGGLPA
ncbi:MAG TPA: futalosine hydrolase [Candidatus Tumulicola sp.]|jgi:futalosine hydrolase